MTLPDYALKTLRCQATHIIDVAEKETPDTNKAEGNQTRLQRARHVSWQNRVFTQTGPKTWMASGKTDGGWASFISGEGQRCNCPDSSRRFGNSYCKHLCSLALAILNHPQQ